MDLLKKLGHELYVRVIVSYQSTLIALAAAAGIVCIDTFTTYLQGLPKFTGSTAATLVFALGALAKKKLAEKVVPPAMLALIIGSLLFAAPARAQEAQPGGVLPQAGACFKDGGVCLQPAVTVIPIVIDFRSGNVSRNVAFGFGYAITFPKALTPALVPGADFLGGTQTGGGWNAAFMLRLGAIRLGPVIQHEPGVTYGGLGVGTGV